MPNYNTFDATGPQGNFFMMPNAVYQLGLSSGAIAVYGFLLRLENRRRGDKAQYTCHPSYKTIGKAVSRSPRTVAKYVRELCDAGLICTEDTTVTTADGQRWNGNLRYTLLPIENAVRQFHDRQMVQLEIMSKLERQSSRREKAHGRKQIPHAEYIKMKSDHAPEELPL